MQPAFAFARRCWDWAGHIHLLWWIIDGILSIGSGTMSVWWTYHWGLPWYVVAVTAIGFSVGAFTVAATIFWLFQLGKEKWRGRNWKDHAQTDARITRNNADSSFPDWPIRDLFFHIKPDLLENTHTPASPWETIGRNVIDRISTGQIQVWGRPVDFQRTLTPSPLMLIPADRWERAEFTYFFFTEDASQAVHVICDRPGRGSDPWKYRDLQFNRAQVLGIWPETPTLSLSDAAKDVYGEIANTALGIRTRERCKSDEEIQDAIASILSKRVEVKGRRPGSSKFEIVPKSERHYSRIIGGGKMFRSTTGIIPEDRKTTFTDLQIARADMVRVMAELKNLE
jgi:hypothetical protein